MNRELPLEEWVATVPDSLRSDPLWKSDYYRLAMYLFDLAWLDCDRIHSDYRVRSLTSQLIRSASSICANMEEAYGRGVGTADYVRVMRISLGEARETKGHYLRLRHILSVELVELRLKIIDQIITKLVGTISTHRKKLNRADP
jgi:four helix bundle protein